MSRGLNRRQNKRLTQITGGCFAVLLILNLSEPSMAFGRSVGFGFTVLLVSVLAVAVLVAALVPAVALQFTPKFKYQEIAFAVFVLLAGAWLQGKAFDSLDRAKPIAAEIVANKIHYFCLDHFDQPRCVQQVISCPRCVVLIDKWERDLMAKNLKTVRSQYPAGFKARETTSVKGSSNRPTTNPPAPARAAQPGTAPAAKASPK